jgi:hypothetical protein
MDCRSSKSLQIPLPTSWAARYNTSAHETDAERRSLGFSFLFSFLPLPTMLQLHPHLAQMITVLLAPAHKTACPSNMGLMTPTWWTLQGRSCPHASSSLQTPQQPRMFLTRMFICCKSNLQCQETPWYICTQLESLLLAALCTVHVLDLN